MSLRQFIKRTQLLLDQALYESRQAIRNQDDSLIRPVEVTQLEERILMSASPLAVLADAPDGGPETDATNSQGLSDLQLLEVVADNVLPPEAVQETVAAANGNESDVVEHTLELVFIDGSISNLDQMIADLQNESALDETRSLEIVVLDTERDGIAQITAALIQYDGIDGMHIVSHGSDGQVKLGSTTLSLDSVDRYQSAISAWQYSMSEEADILIYGCNVAETANGRELLNQLSHLTATDVAGSEDLTGQAELGGNWDLEFVIGDVDTEVVFSARLQASWWGTLGEVTVTTTNDVVDGDADLSSLAALEANAGADGLISLREAIIAANASADADTITLGAGTYTLAIAGSGENLAATGDLDILNDLTIAGQGAAFTTIDGGDLDRVFDVQNGTVTINDTTIQNGDVSGVSNGGAINIAAAGVFTGNRLDIRSSQALSGGGVFNSGDFTLNGSLLTANVATDQGGAIRNTGTMSLTNVTVSGNSAPASSAGVSVDGGTSTLTNVTIASNTGFGLAMNTGISLQNTIITGNSMDDVVGVAVTSLGGNIIGDGTGTGWTGSDAVGVDPLLGALSNNGGPVQTHAIDGLSPAFNYGTDSGSPAEDGRGYTTDGSADAGSFQYLPTLVVTTTNDSVNGTVTSVAGLLANDGGDGISLREAILASNADTGTLELIQFNIAGVGVHTISLGTALPGITDAVVIDGTTESDFSGVPLVAIDASGAGFANGLYLNSGSSGSTIRGLQIRNAQDDGIQIDSDNNTIVGNYIGTDGTNDLGATFDGIRILGDSNQIGGAAAADRNVISGNNDDGIQLQGSASGNIISGNYIGLTADGTSPLGNSSGGIEVAATVTSTQIGGLTAAERNVISGNTEGISISGDGTSIFGNYIGTDATGRNDVGNSTDGIAIYNGADDTTVGGTTASHRNVISGNDNDGVWVNNTSGVTVQGNWIGVDAYGNALGNLFFGIGVDGNSSSILIGGTTADAGNIIANNKFDGISVENTSSDVSIVGNESFDNTGLAIDLADNGVTDNDNSLSAPAPQHDADSGPNNLQNFPVISAAETTGSALRVTGSLASAPNTSYLIDVFSNAAGTADASLHGEARVHLGSFIVATDANGDSVFDSTINGVAVTASDLVTATATAVISPGQIGVDDLAALGSTSEFSQNFAATNTPVTTTISVTNTLDNINGDTSSIAALIAGDGGDGISLREAITAANNQAGADTIEFNIGTGDSGYFDPTPGSPGSGDESWTIDVSSLLPDILDTVTIDGSTQTGWVSGTFLPIVLDGNGIGTGLEFNSNSDGSVLRGLVIRDFGADAVDVENGADNITIAGNFIGQFNSDGTDAGDGEANTFSGVRVDGDNVTIGGSTVSDRNLISGNEFGVLVRGSATNTIVSGNYIGTDITGAAVTGSNNDYGVYIYQTASGSIVGGATSAHGNVFAGMKINSVGLFNEANDNVTIQNNLIGVSADGLTQLDFNGGSGSAIFVDGGADDAQILDNLIAGARYAGIELNSGHVNDGTVIQGNIIGTDATGFLDWGHGENGILIEEATNSVIGGIGAGEANVVAFSGRVSPEYGSGISIQDGLSGNLVRGNSIYSNAGVGIDLSSVVDDGATPNDAGDVDLGSNDFQNWAILNSVSIADDGTLSYELDTSTLVDRAYYFDFYASTDRDGGQVEGRRYLGTETMITDGSVETGTLSGITLATGEYVTVVTSDVLNSNSSEFSNYAVAADSDSDGATPGDLQLASTTGGGLSINEDSGDDVYLEAKDGGAILGNLADFTIEAQLTLGTAPPLFPHILDYATTGERSELSLLLSGNTVRMSIAGNSYGFAGDYAILRDGDVHSVAVTRTGSLLKLHIDGVFQEQLAVVSTAIADNGNLVIGNDQDAFGSQFQTTQAVEGTLYDVRIFNTARTDLELAASFRSDLPFDEAGMVANWRFDQLSSDGVVTDVVSGNNLTVQHINEAGFTASEATLVLSVDENALDGTVVGQVSGNDAEREAQIASLLAGNPDLHYNTETQKFYQVVGGTHFWTAARTAAEAATLNSVNGQLVTIRSATENQFVTDLAASSIGNDVWIGATDATVEGEWRWVEDGAEADLFWLGDENGSGVSDTYQNFESGQPNDVGSNEDVVRLSNSTGKWLDADHDNHDYYGYVVEWKADAVLDATQALTYSIVSQTETGAFAIDSDTGQITLADASLADFESNPTHTLTIRTTDVDDNTYDEDFTVLLNNFIEPTDLSSGIELNTDGGTDAFLHAANGGNIINDLTAITFEVAFEITDPNTVGNTLVSYQNGIQHNEFYLTINPDGQLWLGIDSIGLGELGSVGRYAGLLDGDLHHLAVSWNSGTGEVIFYIDGAQAEGPLTYKSGATIGSGGNLVLGQDQDSTANVYEADEAFRGKLHDVRIWNTVRTAAEIALHHEHKFDSANVPSGLIANWQMKALAGGTTVQDLVDPGNGDLSVQHVGAVGAFTPGNATDVVSISEVAPNGTRVTYVRPSDPEVLNDGAYTYALTDDAAGRFAIDANTGEITVAAANLLDHETNTSHSVRIEVADSAGNTYNETMSIAVNNAFEIAQTVPGPQTTNEDTPLVFSLANGNQVLVSDTVESVDSRLQVFISTNASGTLTLSPNTGALTIPGGANGGTFMTIHGTESDINAAFEGMTFTPASGFNGPVTIDLTTSLGADLVGHYAFENSGDVGQDTSVGLLQSGTTPGINNNAGVFVDGTRGNVLNLDGDDDFIEITGLLGEPSNVTLAAWIDASSTDTSGAVVISMGESPALYLEADGRLTGFYESGGAGTTLTTTESFLGTGWRHVAVSIDTTNQKMVLYVDGVAVETAAATAPIEYDHSPNTHIGRWGAGLPGFDFDGLIDDARIYSRALSSGEISALANDQTQQSGSIDVTVAVKVNSTPAFELPGQVVLSEGSTGYGQNDDIFVLADGSMLVTPYDNDGNSVLLKLASDGSTDTAFGTNGFADNGDIGYLQGVTQQPSDGKIVVTGRDGGNVFVARYHANGTIDSSFGTNGVATIITPSTDDAGDVIVQPDGMILVVGENGDNSFVARFNSTGILDATFGTSGIATFNLGGTSEQLDSVALMSDGRIVAGGESSIILLDTLGALDISFGTNGILSAGHAVSEVLVQADDSIVAVGNNGTSLVVSRFDDGGLPDGTFGTGGTTVWNHPTEDSTGTGIVQQSDGKFVAVGHTTDYPTDWVAVRLTANGDLDTSFADNGAWVMDGSTDFSEAYSVSLYDDGSSEKIVIVGYATDHADSATSTIIRLNSDGSLDEEIGSSSLDGIETFVEYGAAVVLDANVEIFDAELSAASFDGATLTLARNGGADVEDVFSGTGNLVFNGGVLELSLANVGSYVQLNGTLVLNFGNAVTNAQVNEIMQSIAYSNSSTSPPASIQIDWTFSDGNTSGTQGTGGALMALGSTTVNIVDVPEDASLTVPIAQSTDEDTTLEFVSGVNAIVIDSGSTYDPTVTATLTVTNGQLTLQTTNGISFLNSTSNGSSTLTISGTESDINTALDGLQYDPNSNYNGSDTLTITTGSSAATEATAHARYEFLAGSVEDTSGNGRNGVAVGNPAPTIDATRGDVLTFDGDDTVTVTNGTLGLGGEVTIAAWVNLDAGQGDNVVVSLGDQFYIELDNNSSGLGVGAFAFGSGTFTAGGNEIDVAGTGWHHVAATFSDSLNELKVYVDGVPERTMVVNSTPNWAGFANQDITIGGMAAGPNANLNQMAGSLDDVRVYSAALTETEITALAGDNGFDSQTVALTINPVNDAPQLDNSGNLTLTTVVEDDTDPTGDTVAAVLASAGGNRITDNDSGAVEGIAVHDLQGSNGTWQYFLNGGGSWTNFGAVATNSATLLGADDLIRFVPNAEYSGSALISFRAWDQSDGRSAGDTGVDVAGIGTGGTSAYSVGTEAAAVNVSSTNDAPVLTAVAGGGTYNENGSGTFFYSTLTITDVDSADFAGGVLTVSITANGDPAGDDRLTILDGGGVTRLGDSVRYDFGGGPTEVGTVTAGSGVGSVALEITFNANANPTAVQAVGQRVVFNSVSHAPHSAQRTLTMSVTDGDGATSTTATRVMNVIPQNDAPAIANLNGDGQSYTEGDGAVVIDLSGDGLVTDPDSADFDSGTLTVSLTAGTDSAEDELSVQAQGNGAGQINLIGSSVRFSGTTIGTLAGGTSGTPLTITFNTSADAAAISAVIQNITYENTDVATPTTGTRTIEFVLTDGDGGTSTTSATSVNVGGTNDNPVVILTPGGESFTEGASGTFVDSLATVSDADGVDFDGGVLTASIGINGSSQDRLTIQNEGTAAGQVNVVGSSILIDSVAIATFSGGTSGADPLIVTFTAAADQSGVQSVVRRITFSNSSSNPGELQRTILMQLTDGDGGTSVSQSRTMSVAAVNNAPINTLPASQTLDEDSSLILSSVDGTNISINDIDSASSDIRVTLTAADGVLSLAGTTGLTSNVGDGTTTIVIEGPNSAVFAALNGLRFTPNSDFNGPTTISVTSNDLGNYGIGGALSDSDTLNLTVTAVNDDPTVINLNGDSLNYTEGSGAVVVEQGANAVIGDIDSSTLDTGTLTAAFVSGSDSAEDILSIRDQGFLPGQVGVVGSNVFFGGTLVGTFAGGSGGADLVVTFNANSSPLAATMILQNVTYENTDTGAPTAGTRTISFLITDGDGGTGTLSTTSVAVSGSNNLPTLNVSAAGSAFNEDLGPVFVDSSTTVADVDSPDFAGGTLTYALSANGTADDVLSIVANGTGAGQVSLSGSNIIVDSLTVGSFAGGTGVSSPLVITFTSNAASADVQAVAQRVAFNNTSNNPSTADRTISAVLTDGDGGTSATATRVMEVNAVNDSPVLAAATNPGIYSEGGGRSPFDASTLSDADSADFAGGQLTFRIDSGGDGTDTLTLGTAGGVTISGADVLVSGITVGTFAGGTSGTDLIITFNVNATVARVEAVFQSLTISNFEADPTAGLRVVSAVVTDGDGGTSNVSAANVILNAVNDSPISGNASISLSEAEVVTLTSLEFSATDVDNDDSLLTFNITNVMGGQFERISSPQNAIANFTQAEITAGQIVFVHDGSESAPAYDIAVSDGALTTTPIAANVTFTNTNDAPQITSIGNDTVTIFNDGSPVVVDANAPAMLLDNDNPVDYDGAFLLVTGTNFETEDVLGITTTGNIALSSGFADGSVVSVAGVDVAVLQSVVSGSVRFEFNANATAAEVNTILQNVNFATTSSVLGARSIDFVFNDGDGTANGGAETSSTETAYAWVAQAGNGLVATNEDTTYTFVATDFDFTGLVGSDLRHVEVLSLPSNGTLNINGGPAVVGSVVTKAQIDSGELTFVPAPNANGATYASFDFQINNGKPTVSVLVGKGGFYTLTALSLNPTNEILADTDNFGLNGVFESGISIVPPTNSPIDGDYLAQGGVLFNGYTPDGAWTAPELAVVDTWVRNGGVLISTSDNASYDDVSASYGLAIGGGSTGVWEVADAASPIIDGVFGQVGPVGSTFSATGSVSYFDPNSLAVGDQVIAYESGTTFPTIVLRQVGNGWILFTGDEGIFRASMTGGGNVVTPNDILSANIFAWAADLVPSTDFYTMNVDVTPVNDDPVNNGSLPTNVTVIEDIPSQVDLSAIDLSDVDSASGNVTLTLRTTSGGNLTAVGTPQVAVSTGGPGVLILDGEIADLNAFLNNSSSISFTSALNANGNDADTINVEITDNGNIGNGGGGAIDLGTINVDITAVNDTPVNSVPTSYSVTEDTQTPLAGLSIADLDTAAGNMTTRLQVVNGSLNITLSGGAAITAGANDSADVTISGTIAQINATLSSLLYRPDSNLAGNAADSLTITTNDGGNVGTGGPLQDVDSVTIDIAPVNDEQVIATNTGLTVNEGDPGSIIGQSLLNTTDADNAASQIVYQLTSLPIRGTLRLGSTPLTMLSTFTQADINSNQLFYDHDGTENFTDAFGFSVDDGNAVATSGTFSITIVPVNDNDPAISSSSTFNVLEGETAVGTVSATDTDVPTQTLTYSIIGGNDGGVFSIDGVAGTLTFTTAPDFDLRADANSDNVFEVTVQVSDGHGRNQQQAILVTVENIDEFDTSTIADNNAAPNEILESAAAGTTVGLTALATDGDIDDVVTYTLDDDAGGLFAINGSSGVVTLLGSLDRETAAAHDIIVRATSTDTSSSTQSFTISVVDFDEFDTSAISDTDTAIDEINENVAIGTSVGITAFSEDLDATTNVVTYSLDDSAGGLFAINSFNGTVTTASTINFESSGATQNITVRAASDDGSSVTQSYTITINDLDEFDVSPVIDTDGSANTFDENVPAGAVVGITAFSQDLDGTANSVAYSLDDSAGGLFTIDSATGVVTTTSSIDFEVVGGSHDIVVRALSADGSSTTQSFNITLNDIDEFDVTPVIDTDSSTDQIDENVAAGTVVGITAFSEDPDGSNNTVTYTLDDNAGGLFAVNSSNGEISTAAAIDFEAVGNSLGVVVRATSTDGSTLTQAYTITINDLDEFDVSPVADTDGTANTIDENVPIGTAVGITAFSEDLDGTENSVAYSLDDSAGGLFTIDSATGVVTTATSVDFEAVGGSHSIVVRALSADDSSTTQSFNITLNDIDEFDVTPIVDTDNNTNQVDENAAIGTAVNITAFSEDFDSSNDTVTYNLDDDAGGLFEIDSVSGVVTTAALIDFEVHGSSQSIVVRSTSTDGSSATESYTIAVGDLNEFDVLPLVDTDSTANLVDENVAIGTSVGITAFSEDLDGTDNAVSYTLDDNAGGLFRIDSVTGIVTVADDIDFESTGGAVAVVIRATSADDSSATFSQTITVNDLNDIPPVISVGQSFTVSEFASTGTLVGLVAAEDADTVGNVSDWTITAGNEDGVFTINPVTGQLSVADSSSINFEITSGYRLTLTVSDGITVSASQAVDILVQNENDTPELAPATFSVDENSSNGSVFGAMISSDEDVGDVLTYSIVGPAGSPFAVDGSTGVLSVSDVSQLDFESTTSFTLILQIQDSGGLTDTQSVLVSIADVNEVPVDISLVGGSVSENSAVGTLVATVTGIDVDANEVQQYSLSDDAGGRFSIDTSTGQIRVAESSLLDFESASTHQIVVRTTDSGGLSREETFGITLGDVNEAPTAVDDQFTGDQLEDLVVDVDGLKSNDFDIDGDGIAVILVNGPSNGSLLLRSDGTFVYTPEGVFSGIDTFDYVVFDGVLISDVATVEITVQTTVAGNSSQAAPIIETTKALESSNEPEDSETEEETQEDNSDSETTEETTGVSGTNSAQVNSEDSETAQGTVGESKSSEILRSTSSQLFVAIFMDDVPESESLSSSEREFRRSLDEENSRSSSAMSRFLFNQIQTANPFVQSTRFDIEQTEYIQQQAARTFGDIVFEKVVVGSSAAVSTSVSVGYAVWMLRGGSLLTSILSSLPVWQGFDPLPVLESFDEDGEGDDETLASIVAGHQ